MVRRRLILGMLAILAVCPPAAAAGTVYVNARFGTTITYPADVFTRRMLPPDNGDGQSWRAPDGGTLLVYARIAVAGETPKGIEAAAKSDSGRRLTYSRSGSDWVVLSGIETGSVFYERYRFGDDGVIHVVVVGYPVDLAPRYDPLVGPIARSLSGP